MEDERAVATVGAPDAPAEWRTREEVRAMGRRIKTMLPGGDKLTDNQAAALGQYSLVMDLNPVRGEVYGYADKKGNLCIVDGYKAMVRWALDKCPYSDKYEPLPVDETELHKIRCWIMRDDRKQSVQEWVSMGAPWNEAFALVAVYADGVVNIEETTGYRKPPVGWTWEQVARKRALKNALNLSHGAPSPREIAALSWRVNGVTTVTSDWDGIPEHITRDGQGAEYAAMRARTRETRTAWEQMTDEERVAKAKKNSDQLYGAEDFDGFDTPSTNGPEWDDETVEAGEDEPVASESSHEPPKPANGDEGIVSTQDRVNELLAAVKAKTGNHYKHAKHLFNALADGDGSFDWPHPSERDRWNALYTQAVKRVEDSGTEEQGELAEFFEDN